MKKKKANISLLEMSVVGEVLDTKTSHSEKASACHQAGVSFPGFHRLKSNKSKLDDFTNKISGRETIVVIFRESFHILYEQCIH